MLIATAIIFGIFSFLSAYVTTFNQLILVRGLCGIGMGGIVPAAMAYGSEYAPHRLRATITTLVWMALPVGGMISGFAAVWLIPHYGWESMFIVGGVMPIVLAVLLAIAMPESLAFLSTQGRDQAAMRQIAVRIAPALAGNPDLHFYRPDDKLPGVPLKHLFTEGRAAGTILLWIVFFLSFFLIIWFVSWVPTFVRMTTNSTSAVGTSLAVWNIGSLVATALIGVAIDKFGYYRILPAAFTLITVAVCALGFFISADFMLVASIITICGFVAGGSNSGLMSLASNSYPVAIRSTGVGAAYALGGRSGALCGPLLGSILLQIGWAPTQICYVMGVPMLLGTVVLMLLRRQAHFRHDVTATPAAVPERA
jgi:AAHS family 4-hydroxybenzoate transporter-like MFS transporter